MLIVMSYAILLTKETSRHLLPGDSRIQEANIIWIEPQATCWIQNSDTEVQKGELALEITMDITSTRESGNAWGPAMDACIPVMDLIDTTRSVPYSIQQVQQVCGISYTFGRVTQVQQVLAFLPF
jgi:DNA-directed RNA polymerase-5 subunit 1